MRWTIPMLNIATLGLMLVQPATAREYCDTPEPGVHFKVTIGSGHRDAATQEQFDMMALNKIGVKARSVTRTSDGCLEAWVPNGDGTFSNQYFDPDEIEGSGSNGLGLKLSLD